MKTRNFLQQVYYESAQLVLYNHFLTYYEICVLDISDKADKIYIDFMEAIYCENIQEIEALCLWWKS